MRRACGGGSRLADMPPPYETRSVDNGPEHGRRARRAPGPRRPPVSGSRSSPRASTTRASCVTAPERRPVRRGERPGRVKLLRDADGDGKPEVATVFAQGLDKPFGHGVLSCRAEPALGLRREHGLAWCGSLIATATEGAAARPRCGRRHPGRRAAARRRALDARHRVLARWQEGCSSPSARVERRETRPRSGAPTSWRSLRTVRTSGSSPRASATPVGLAIHPRDGRAVGVGERARRPGRRPGAGLRHAGQGGRLLRLAVVLHRAEPGPAPRRGSIPSCGTR